MNAQVRRAACLALSAVTLHAAPINPEETAVWLRHVVPLPREIAFAGQVTFESCELALQPRFPSSASADRALQELRETLRLPPASPAAARFTITLQLGGPEAESLRALKSAGQAYRIFPEPETNGLRLVALESRGLYYASKTLQQLVRARSSPEQITLPLLTVRDWPEMADRGLWGVDAFNCLEWLAERKLNYVEQIAWVSVDATTRRGRARPKAGHEPLLELGPQLGIQFVPVVLHLEQLEGKGVFEAFPNLRAKGNPDKPGAVCYSQPEFVSVLADCLVDLARLPHVSEVDVWMAENLSGKGGCKCDACRKTDRSVLELRTILAAWHQAQERAGHFGLRVLTSEETYPSHNLLFAELPAEVKLWYYHSLLTYAAWERPMITGETARLAAGGHWVGVCPSLVAHVGFPLPFSSAPFVHYRIREFVDRKLGGVLGYPSPRVRYARFNVEALAEWTWNPQGRTVREFAIAWATREGLRSPERFADWAALHGTTAWDVYGSNWPAGEQRRVPGPVAELLRKGALPEFSEVKWGLYPSPWGDIKSRAQLDAAVEAQARAMAIARELGVEEFLQESLVVQGFLNALQALAELKPLVRNGRVAPEQHAHAARQFEAYAVALDQARHALPAWDRTLAKPGDAHPFAGKAIERLAEMQRQMAETRRALGL